MTSHSCSCSNLPLISFQSRRRPGLELLPRSGSESSSASSDNPHWCLVHHRSVAQRVSARAAGHGATAGVCFLPGSVLARGQRRLSQGTATGKRRAGRRSRCLHSLTNWPGSRPHFPCSERVLAAVLTPKVS